MLDQLRRRLSYANVMSTLAVFIALGGSSYAALKISGSNINNRSISASKLKRNTLSGLEIRESRLGRVPRAQQADNAANAGTLDGRTASDLQIGCPMDTFPSADVCVESTPRQPAAYGSAILECRAVGRPASRGRRLPTHGELESALYTVQLAAGGELTSEVYPSDSHPGELDVLFVTDQFGSVARTPNRGTGAKAYRCVTDPFN